MPKWRILTWVILAFNLLMLAWIVFGVGGAASENCVGEAAATLDACQAGTAVGAGIATVFIVFLWAMGDVILGVIWLVTNSSKKKKAEQDVIAQQQATIAAQQALLQQQQQQQPPAAPPTA